MDKLTVEVIKDKKGLDTLYYIKRLPVTNGLNFFKVDFNSIYAYNKPEVFYAFYPKFAFFNINL